MNCYILILAQLKYGTDIHSSKLGNEILKEANSIKLVVIDWSNTSNYKIDCGTKSFWKTLVLQSIWRSWRYSWLAYFLAISIHKSYVMFYLFYRRFSTQWNSGAAIEIRLFQVPYRWKISSVKRLGEWGKL